jgi:hypothetical protein
VCSEIILGERDRERGVGRQVELGIPLAPVSMLMRGWLMNVDSESVCLAKEMFLDILDNGDVDGGESARAVDLFGCHVCGCVNVVMLICLRGSKVETSPRKSHVDAPRRSTFMQGCRFRAVPNPNLIRDLLTQLSASSPS